MSQVLKLPELVLLLQRSEGRDMPSSDSQSGIWGREEGICQELWAQWDPSTGLEGSPGSPELGVCKGLAKRLQMGRVQSGFLKQPRAELAERAVLPSSPCFPLVFFIYLKIQQ